MRNDAPLAHDIPGALCIPASGALRRFLASADIDGLREITAILAVSGIGPCRLHLATRAGFRVFPGLRLAIGVALQRLPGRLRVILLVGTVKRAANLAAQIGADQGAGTGCKQLATAAADPDLYRQVLGVFLEQLTSRFTALSQTSSGLDATPAILEGLHTLKGTAGSLGAMDIAESARHLEACLKQYGHARQEDIQRLSRALEQARRGVTLILSH